jgi:bifunctional non-homologous end joining protein LigD
MLKAAELLKVVLDEIGLRSFPKTSGGKGFHVVVPLTRRQGWDEIKAFAHAVAPHMARVAFCKGFLLCSGLRAASEKFSSTTCAIVAARALSLRSLCAPGRGWGYRCRFRGTNRKK